MIVEGRITDESIKSKLYVDEFGLFREKITNADRIRAMSDEELAKTISGDQIYPWCTEEPCKYDSCTDCVLAWLKQEAET